MSEPIKTFEVFMNKPKTIWEIHGENLPSIFKQTIYRSPTEKELLEFQNFDLTSEEILQGIEYTIIGRGMKGKKEELLIFRTSERLHKLFPDNREYLKLFNSLK